MQHGQPLPPFRQGPRTLSLASVLRMTDAQAERTFAGVRWPETDGKAVCPHCGCPTCYEARRPSGALRFRCKACRKDFSLTSGTLFAFHKLPLQTYLAATVIFCNEVKGKSALALSRGLGRAVQDGLGAGPQAARGDGDRGARLQAGRRRQDGGGGWGLLRRLREARQPQGEPPGSPPGPQPKPASGSASWSSASATASCCRARFKTEGSALAYIRKPRCRRHRGSR